MALFTTRNQARSPQTRVAVVAILVMVSFAVTGMRSASEAATGVPSGPCFVAASPGNTRVFVSWGSSASDGGSAITHYVITPYLEQTALPAKTVGVVKEATIDGLTNGKQYRFRVAAVNANGTGSPGWSVPTAVGAPVAPTRISAVQGADQAGGATATVRWTAGSNNGWAITSFSVTPYANGVALPPRAFPAPAAQALVTGLTYGNAYTFKVAATNANGTGPKSLPSWVIELSCTGKAMVNGQSDINSAPSGTTFCLSGTHNWTLTPKSGDKLIGPAVLDGAHSTVFAILGNGTSNVTLSALEVRNYRVVDPNAAISAHGTTGWMFRDLRVHDNGTSGGGGTGADLGVSSKVIGGRYYNNRQLGIGGGGGADGWFISGAEIDHNNFTNDTYTTRNISCGYQAGGVKWTADNTTIQNSSIHDNACKGLWADLNADNTKILDNVVFGNWDEGIFIEISSGATVTGNTVNRNGLRNYNGDGSGCPWLWGGGITLASSDHAVIANNSLAGNCNGITGTQQTRTDGNPGLLIDDSIRDNVITGPGGKTGVAADNGADLTTRNIVFTANKISDHTFCALHC